MPKLMAHHGQLTQHEEAAPGGARSNELLGKFKKWWFIALAIASTRKNIQMAFMESSWGAVYAGKPPGQ